MIDIQTWSRAHTQRLRFYWSGRKGQGGASMTDNTDLDIERHESYGIVYFRITPAGEQELALQKGLEIARRAPHNKLAARLARWLQSKGRITWENIELRAGTPGKDACVVRPDVYSLAATYNAERINPCIHEVKISRADFLADLANPAKREGYAKLAETVFYACPDGLIDHSEVPQGFGLVVERSQGQFHLVKRSKKKPLALTPHTFMNLILKPGTAPVAAAR